MSTSERWSNLNQLPVNRFFKVESNPRNWLPAMFFQYRNDRETHIFNFEHEYRHSLRLIAASAMATQEQRSVAAWLHENVTKKHFLAAQLSDTSSQVKFGMQVEEHTHAHVPVTVPASHPE
ncbi:MAG: hypothetical protein BYD32DRAFT_441988 [Podila humilis]|nr:MAG: hypothetical protein BYD32DRAFT_441988 [Podila humilis]